MFRKRRKADMAIERERAKAGGYKANWLIEDLQAQNREVISELETMLNVRLDASEVYRLVGRVIVKLHKTNETLKALSRIYE